MELSPMLFGAIMFILLLMALRRPSQYTERIYVPIDVPVQEKMGCMPIIVAIVLFLVLAALIRS